MKKDDDNESGTLRTALAIIILALVTFAAMGFAWIAIQDRLNGLDAYRTVELKNQRDGARKDCEENHKTLQQMQEWIRQQQLKPPLDIMTISECRNFQTIETQKEH